MARISFLLLCTLFAIGCSKGPGEGGRASIKGSVITEVRLVLSNAATKQTEFAAADQEIYIIYGDDIAIGDRVRTNYKGEFEFAGLREGNYTVYTYSEDTSGEPGVDQNKMPILAEVVISDKNGTVEVPTLRRFEGQ